MKHILVVLLSALALAACSSNPKTASPADTAIAQVDWPTHFKNIQAIKHWQASAKFAISSNQNTKSARLSWKQNQSLFDITFFGPFGHAGPRLFGDENSATLAVPKEVPIKSSNTSSLLEQKFGWRLPVENAKYWIMGIPSPESESNVTLKDERLLSLTQDGWTISYSRYKLVNNDYRPTRVIITRDDLKILLVIYDWHPEPAASSI